MTPAGASEKVSRAAWVAVGLLWVVALFNYLDRNVIATLHDPIEHDIPMTEAGFGLLTSVFLWVYALFSPACGFLADRFSRRKVIFASLFIWSAVTWLTGCMHSFAGLVATRALMGVSEACFLPAALALVCDHHRGSTRSRATALLNTGSYAGATLSGLGGYIAALGGWRVGYTLLGAAGVGYSLALIIFLKDGPKPDSKVTLEMPEKAAPPVSASAAFRELFGHVPFWIMEALNALTAMTNWTIYVWMPALLHERFNLGLGAAGISATAFLQIPSFIAVIGGGYWADRWSRLTPRARMFVPAIGYCIAAPGLWVVGSGGTLGLTLAGISTYGIGRGFYDGNTMPILRQIADERYSATGFGFLNCVSCIFGGLMAYLGGSLRDAHMSLDTVFRSCALGLLVTSALLLTLKPRPETLSPLSLA
jgi:MFS family permease